MKSNTNEFKKEEIVMERKNENQRSSESRNTVEITASNSDDNDNQEEQVIKIAKVNEELTRLLYPNAKVKYLNPSEELESIERIFVF